MASKERFKYENGEVDKYEDAQNNNLHKYLCRGKDVMTIYSLLAIYTWVLIEGNVSFTVCLKVADIVRFFIDFVYCHTFLLQLVQPHNELNFFELTVDA